jgi:hypothetical protein
LEKVLLELQGHHNQTRLRTELAGGAWGALRLLAGRTLELVVAKVLKSFKRIGSGKIKAAMGAIKTSLATFDSLENQSGTRNVTLGQFSQNGFSLPELYAPISA